MPSLHKLAFFAVLPVLAFPFALSGLFLISGCTSSSELKVAGQSPTSPTPTPTPAPNPLSISTTSLAVATVGAAYSAPVAATGGTTPYAFSATGLPAGLAIAAANGTISGTPAANASSTSITIYVSDSTQPTPLTASATLSLTVMPAPTVPSINIGSCSGINLTTSATNSSNVTVPSP
jgi:hypothetical protein